MQLRLVEIGLLSRRGRGWTGAPEGELDSVSATRVPGQSFALTRVQNNLSVWLPSVMSMWSYRSGWVSSSQASETVAQTASVGRSHQRRISRWISDGRSGELRVGSGWVGRCMAPSVGDGCRRGRSALPLPARGRGTPPTSITLSYRPNTYYHRTLHNLNTLVMCRNQKIASVLVDEAQAR